MDIGLGCGWLLMNNMLLDRVSVQLIRAHQNCWEMDSMKNTSFFIVSICYIQLACLIFAYINQSWALETGLLFIISVLIISIITFIRFKRNKTDAKYWDIFKSYFISIMGIELILLFLIMTIYPHYNYFI